MLFSIFTFILAILGLGLLVLIHEAGHYVAARWMGMRVETFSVGFGKPFFSVVRSGVRINVCWIPFGGYVKIAGMERKRGEPVYMAPDGFFSKSPSARTVVALAGPLANILLAFVAFAGIWLSGGREKNFSDVSTRVGWLDPQSDLCAHGVGPGDRIISYNGTAVRCAKDHLQAAMTNGGRRIKVQIEPVQGGPIRTVVAKTYQHPFSLEPGILTSGVLSPAAFLVWNPVPGQALTEAEKLSGIQSNDRLVWMDGEPLFSSMQLSALLDDRHVMVTVLRQGSYAQVRIPRKLVGELNLSPEVRGELSDWQYAAGFGTSKLGQLWFIPYNLTSECVVEGPIPSLEQERATDGLLTNDRIVAVSGQKISSSAEIFSLLQQRHAIVIVERGVLLSEQTPFEEADAVLCRAALAPECKDLIRSLGTPAQKSQCGSFVLLNAITPKTRLQLFEALGKEKEIEALRREEAELLQSIDDPKLRAQAAQQIRSRESQLYLGLNGIRDLQTLYNPSPFSVCLSVAEEVYQTVAALFGGRVGPRWMSGPVGIMYVIQQQWSVSWREAIFWLGMISINLAILNLLPLPVLDGGYILLSLFEQVTKIRVSPAVVERIALPFAILLVVFLVYLTYHDLARLLSSVFSRWAFWKGG